MFDINISIFTCNAFAENIFNFVEISINLCKRQVYGEKTFIIEQNKIVKNKLITFARSYF